MDDCLAEVLAEFCQSNYARTMCEYCDAGGTDRGNIWGIFSSVVRRDDTVKVKLQSNFEQRSRKGAVPDKWQFLPSSSGDMSWALDSEEVRPGSSPGSSSLRFNCTRAASNFSSRLLSAPIAAEPNRTYQLSAFAKLGGHGGDRPWIWLVQVDSSGKQIMRLPTGIQVCCLGHRSPVAGL